LIPLELAILSEQHHVALTGSRIGNYEFLKHCVIIKPKRLISEIFVTTQGIFAVMLGLGFTSHEPADDWYFVFAS